MSRRGMIRSVNIIDSVKPALTTTYPVTLQFLLHLGLRRQLKWLTLPLFRGNAIVDWVVVRLEDLDRYFTAYGTDGEHLS